MHVGGGWGEGVGGGIVIYLVLMHSKHLVQNKKWSCIDIHVYVVYGTAKYHKSHHIIWIWVSHKPRCSFIMVAYIFYA